MFLNSVLVSTSFTVVAAITEQLDPVLLTFIRFFWAVVLLSPYVAWRYGFHCSLSLLLRGLAIGGCVVFFFWCMFLALRFTTALHTSVLFTLVPSISGIYALILLGERLRRPQVIALVCGLVGALWVIFKGDFSMLFSLEWNRGDGIFFLGCLAMGLYSPLVSLLHRGEPMLLLTYWVLVGGLIWLVVFGAPQIVTTSWNEISFTVWAGVVYLAVFTTIITFFLNQYCLLFLGAARVTAYSYLYPALVVLLQFLLGKGLPEIQIFPGIVIILLAMLVLQRGTKRA